MKNKGAFFLIIAAAGAYLISKLKRDALKITAKVKSISIDSRATAKEYYLKLICIVKLDVINTTDVGGQINSINAEIFYNGSAIANIANTTVLNIAANSSNLVSLKVAIPSLKIFSTVNQVIDAFRNRKEIIVDIVGTVKTNYGTIPIKQTVKLV